MQESMKQRARKLFSVAVVLLVPLFLIFYVWAPPPQDAELVLDTRAVNYPAAVLSLRSTSELLVTVAMAVLGAIGLIVARGARSGPLIIGLAATGFVAALMVIFFAGKVGVLAAYTLAASNGDHVAALLSMLNNEAVATLVAGLSLAVIAVLEAFAAEKG
jgi:cytochrome bd-type quinol oxidase subunit 2